MAIPEACELWIEQRVQQELEGRDETGKSLREIGRLLADEIEKLFETKVKPMTITKRASRLEQGVTNVTPEENQMISAPKPKLEKLEKPKHGGARRGAGRKASRGGGYKKPILNDPRRRHSVKRMPGISDFIVEVAGDMDILGDKLSRIYESIHLVKDERAKRIFCNAMQRMKEGLLNHDFGCEGEKDGQSD